MKFVPAAPSLRRLFVCAASGLGLSLAVPPDNMRWPWDSVYPVAQGLLLAACLVLAVADGLSRGEKRFQVILTLPVQLLILAAAGILVQLFFPLWPLVTMVFLILFPLTVFSRQRALLWVPAAVLAMMAGGRYLFLGEGDLLQWSGIFLVFSGVLGWRMSRDREIIRHSNALLDRIRKDARETMDRVRRDGLTETGERIWGEQAAMALTLEEDDELFQKLLVWGCRYFHARTGVLLVPDDPGFFRVRAAVVNKGAKLVGDMVPADKGFIHIAQERGGVLYLSDAMSAGSSLGFYAEGTVVGSFLVKIVYDDQWAKDAGADQVSEKVTCVLYFDSHEPGAFSLEGTTRKRLEEFGKLVGRAMKLSRALQKVVVNISAKYAIARYARNLTRHLDPEKITEKVLEAVMEALRRCNGAVVLLADEGLNIIRTRGDAVKDLSLGKILRDEPSQVGLLLRRFAEAEEEGGDGTNRGEIIINSEKKRPSPYFFRGEKLGKVTSFTAIPSFMPDDKGRLVLKAVIAAVSRERNAFGPEEMEDLRTLAGMMAPALDNALQHRKVDQLSRTDDLTGLLNRRTFQIVLDGKIRRVIRGYDSSIALIMVDGDRFKNVNDEYGHPVGDEVLVELARRLKGGIRSNDAVARFGGEEFTVVLDNVDERKTRRIAEKLRKDIGTRCFETSVGDLNVTASFGFAVLHGKGPHSREQLLEWADRALYYAKESGRDRVVAFADIEGKGSVDREPLTEKAGTVAGEEKRW